MSQKSPMQWVAWTHWQQYEVLKLLDNPHSCGKHNHAILKLHIPGTILVSIRALSKYSTTKSFMLKWEHILNHSDSGRRGFKHEGRVIKFPNFYWIIFNTDEIKISFYSILDTKIVFHLPAEFGFFINSALAFINRFVTVIIYNDFLFQYESYKPVKLFGNPQIMHMCTYVILCIESLILSHFKINFRDSWCIQICW